MTRAICIITTRTQRLPSNCRSRQRAKVIYRCPVVCIVCIKRMLNIFKTKQEIAHTYLRHRLAARILGWPCVLFQRKHGGNFLVQPRGICRRRQAESPTGNRQRLLVFNPCTTAQQRGLCNGQSTCYNPSQKQRSPRVAHGRECGGDIDPRNVSTQVWV